MKPFSPFFVTTSLIFPCYGEKLEKNRKMKMTLRTAFEAIFSMRMGASGLEPPKTEVGGFTVPCNCRYATPPRKVGRDRVTKFRLYSNAFFRLDL
jgi:hypothetical protein